MAEPLPAKPPRSNGLVLVLNQATNGRAWVPPEKLPSLMAFAGRQLNNDGPALKGVILNASPEMFEPGAVPASTELIKPGMESDLLWMSLKTNRGVKTDQSKFPTVNPYAVGQYVAGLALAKSAKKRGKIEDWMGRIFFDAASESDNHSVRFIEDVFQSVSPFIGLADEARMKKDDGIRMIRDQSHAHINALDQSLIFAINQAQLRYNHLKQELDARLDFQNWKTVFTFLSVPFTLTGGGAALAKLFGLFDWLNKSPLPDRLKYVGVAVGGILGSVIGGYAYYTHKIKDQINRAKLDLETEQNETNDRIHSQIRKIKRRALKTAQMLEQECNRSIRECATLAAHQAFRESMNYFPEYVKNELDKMGYMGPDFRTDAVAREKASLFILQKLTRDAQLYLNHTPSLPPVSLGVESVMKGLPPST